MTSAALVGILALLLGILPAGAAKAFTVIFHDITADTVWVSDVYHVLQTIHVKPNATLRVQAGAVVKFVDGSQLVVDGTLLTEGTAESRVSFTSLSDDNIAGDTEGNGPSVGRPGAWRGVRFNSGSGASVLSYCDIWFAGGSANALVSCSNSSPTIRDCRLRAGTTGVRCESGAAPLIERTVIDGCTGVPIATDLYSSPIFDGVVFGAEQDNEFDAVGLLGGLTSESAVIPRLSLAMGTEAPVDISYLLMSTIRVDTFHTLSFEPGVVIKFMPETLIRVDGRLETPSSALERVVFTSLHDDQHGFPRDTHRDGNAASPAAHDWGGIIATKVGRLLIQDTDILYAGAAAVQLGSMDANATILRSKLAYSGSGLSVWAGSVTLTDCDLQGNLGAGVRYALEADVTWTDLRASGNGIAAIELLAGEVLTNRILAPRSIGARNNITYYIADQDIDIAPGVTLTIDPGVTVKFGSATAGIMVRGRLVASAPIENPIIFTSVHDDCPGSPRDTRSDGWYMAPCPGDWGAIKFKDGDPGSVLDGCIVRFGGGTCNGAVEITRVIVDIRNCLFEYNMTAFGSEGATLSLVRDKNGATFTNVAFRQNVLDSMTRIGGTLAEDGVLEDPGDYSHLYLLDEDLIIPFGSHLDILPGVNIVAQNAGIDVFGSLDWSGEFDSVSRITGPSGWCGSGGGGGGGDIGPGIPRIDQCDQVFGCDIDSLDPLDCTVSKGDEVAESEWEGIRFHASSDDARTVLRDLVIGGAEEPVWLEDSSPLFERVIFDGMADNGIGILGRSAPRFNECIFRNGSGVPVRTSLSAAPQFADPLFVSNGLHGLGLVSQSFSDDMRLDAAIIENSGLNCFIALGDLHVAPGQTLTIGPGVVLKFVEDSSLRVDGQLRIEGVNDFGRLVALTSVSDDLWGGDSNRDGAATRAHDTTWGGIKFSAITVDATPLLQGCVIANVHGADSDGAIRVAGAAALDLTEVLLVGNDRHIVFDAGGGDPSLGLISLSDFAGGPAVSAIENPYHGYTVAAEDCWWGAASGPRDSSNDVSSGGLFNPEGEGSTVTDGVDYDPFSTVGSHVRLLGDASRDGRVSVFDASVVIRYLAGLWPLEAEALLRADANCDGNVDALDASVLLGLAAGSVEWLDCQSVPEFPVSGIIPLQYDGFDVSKQELSLRWEGPRLPRAASMRLRPLQQGVRILDLRLSLTPGQQAISATGGGSDEKSFVFACDQELAPGSLLCVELELVAGVDLSRALVRIEDLWVDGNDEPGLDIRAEGGASAQPQRVRPLAVKPNPFNPATMIDFVVSGNSGQRVDVSLDIFDLSGRLVRTLVHESLEPGTYQRYWKGLDDDGQRAASGVYFLRLVQGGSVVKQKLTLLK
jgi:hypothetical protein